VLVGRGSSAKVVDPGILAYSIFDKASEIATRSLIDVDERRQGNRKPRERDYVRIFCCHSRRRRPVQRILEREAVLQK